MQCRIFRPWLITLCDLNLWGPCAAVPVRRSRTLLRHRRSLRLMRRWKLRILPPSSSSRSWASTEARSTASSSPPNPDHANANASIPPERDLNLACGLTLRCLVHLVSPSVVLKWLIGGHRRHTEGEDRGLPHVPGPADEYEKGTPTAEFAARRQWRPRTIALSKAASSHLKDCTFASSTSSHVK